MKKLFLTASLATMLAGSLGAEDVVPVGVRLTFNEIGTGATHDTEFLKNSAPASLTSYTIVKYKEESYLRYDDLSPFTDYLQNANGNSFLTKNAVIKITGGGLSLSQDFTLTFAAKKSGEACPDWGNIMAVHSEGKSVYVQNGTNQDGHNTQDNFGMWGDVGSGGFGSEAVLTESFTRLTLVYSAKTETLPATFTLYQDTAKVGSWTSSLGDSGDVTLYVGGNADANKTALYIDEVGVYNAALTETQVAYLKGRGSVSIIPEPATASLSLLALAGLLARRRRR